MKAKQKDLLEEVSLQKLRSKKTEKLLAAERRMAEHKVANARESTGNQQLLVEKAGYYERRVLNYLFGNCLPPDEAPRGMTVTDEKTAENAMFDAALKAVQTTSNISSWMQNLFANFNGMSGGGE